MKSGKLKLNKYMNNEKYIINIYGQHFIIMNFVDYIYIKIMMSIYLMKVCLLIQYGK